MSTESLDARQTAPPVVAARSRTRSPLLRLLPAVVVLVVLAVLPYVAVTVPFVLPGRVNGPGTMQLLAVCFIFAGFALSYDVIFGRTGLLSFGHALFVASGSYLLTISLSTLALPLPLAILLALGVTTALALVVGGIALRVSGIAFAMVTLAFAQAASIIVLRNPADLTGGEEGLVLNREAIPTIFVGVQNAPYRYWLALGFVVLAWVLVALLVRSRAGHAMAAVRENESRAAVLGYEVYRVKLLAIVVGALIGGLGGVVHAIVLGGSSPHLTTTEFTLALLLMVVLGGAGRMWGAVAGGVIYHYADARLIEVSGSSAVGALPDIVQRLLAEPLFILGIIFMVVVYFAPQGITGLGAKLLRKERA